MDQKEEISNEIKLVRTALFEVSTQNNDDRTIEISFSSEEPVQRTEGFEILDHSTESVDLTRLNAGAGLFIDHDTSIRSQVGQVANAWIDSAARKGRALVRFGRSALADDIWKNIESNVFPGVSFGYVVLKSKAESNNTYRVTKWLPFELSLVGTPADINVGFGRSLENDQKPITQPSEETRERESEELLNFQTKQGKKSMENLETEVRSAPQVDATKLINQERSRMASINQLASDFSHLAEVRSMADQAISAGTEVAEFQSQILSKMRSAPTQQVFFGQSAQVTDNVEADPKKGFRHFAEFTSSVVSMGLRHGISPEIQKRAAPSVFANTNTGADGGYAIPPGFANEIIDLGMDETSLLPLTRNTPVTGNNMTFPYSEKQPWLGGVQSYWRSEAADATQSKAEIGRLQLQLNPLTTLCAATDEMLSDQSAMASFLMTTMGRSINWRVNDSILNGLGSDQPVGILQSSGTVEIAKETNQAADTIVAKNILNMYARVFQNGGNLVWLIHPDAFPEIAALTLGDRPIWSDSFKDMPNGALLGKQIILTDACKTLGDAGDIVLANMDGYYTITKPAGAEWAESMHIWFDQSITAFRLSLRIDGSPLIHTAIPPANGTKTRGFFAKIANRA